MDVFISGHKPGECTEHFSSHIVKLTGHFKVWGPGGPDNKNIKTISLTVQGRSTMHQTISVKFNESGSTKSH